MKHLIYPTKFSSFTVIDIQEFTEMDVRFFGLLF